MWFNLQTELKKNLEQLKQWFNNDSDYVLTIFLFVYIFVEARPAHQLTGSPANRPPPPPAHVFTQGDFKNIGKYVKN